MTAKVIRRTLEEAQHAESSDINLSDRNIVRLDGVPSHLWPSANITRLTLSHNKISEIPTILGSLDSLESLNLFNNLIEHVPLALCSLYKLRVLNLGMNKLATLPRGFGQFAALEILDLSYNQLNEKTVPANLFMIKTLRALYLSDNEFTELPSDVGELTGLRILALRDCRLISLPASIGKLVDLQELHLQGNRLTVLPPEITSLDTLLTSSKSIFKMDNNPWVPLIQDQLFLGISHVVKVIRRLEYRTLYNRHMETVVAEMARGNLQQQSATLPAKQTALEGREELARRRDVHCRSNSLNTRPRLGSLTRSISSDKRA